jgi:hypothetical protein
VQRAPLAPIGAHPGCAGGRCDGASFPIGPTINRTARLRTAHGQTVLSGLTEALVDRLPADVWLPIWAPPLRDAPPGAGGAATIHPR